MFIYTHPTYPRRGPEKLFKYCYNVTLLINFAAFFLTVTSFSGKFTSTYDSYSRGAVLKLHPSLVAMLTDCSTRQEIVINGVTATATMNIETMEYGFLGMTALAIGIFVCHGLLMATDFTTKLLYSWNIRKFRIRGLVIRFNWIQPFWLLLYTVFITVLILASDSSRQFVQSYVETCSKQMLASKPQEYERIEATADVIFGTNFTGILVVVLINAGVYLLAIIFILYQGLLEENKQLVKYEDPWEKGCFGLPDRLSLIRWNKARSRLAEVLINQKLRKPTNSPEDPDDEEALRQALEAAVFLPNKYLVGAVNDGLIEDYFPNAHEDDFEGSVQNLRGSQTQGPGQGAIRWEDQPPQEEDFYAEQQQQMERRQVRLRRRQLPPDEEERIEPEQLETDVDGDAQDNREAPEDDPKGEEEPRRRKKKRHHRGDEDRHRKGSRRRRKSGGAEEEDGEADFIPNDSVGEVNGDDNVL